MRPGRSVRGRFTLRRFGARSADFRHDMFRRQIGTHPARPELGGAMGHSRRVGAKPQQAGFARRGIRPARLCRVRAFGAGRTSRQASCCLKAWRRKPAMRSGFSVARRCRRTSRHIVGSVAYWALTKRRVAAILRNGRAHGRYFASELASLSAELHFTHGLYVTLRGRRALDEATARQAAEDMSRDLGGKGFPIRHAGSFGFDFAATEWFRDATTDRYSVGSPCRICRPSSGRILRRRSPSGGQRISENSDLEKRPSQLRLSFATPGN